MKDGTEGAYRAFAALPHDEAGYNATFNTFNSNVTRVCFPQDPGCPKNAAVWDMQAAAATAQQHQQHQAVALAAAAGATDGTLPGAATEVQASVWISSRQHNLTIAPACILFILGVPVGS